MTSPPRTRDELLGRMAEDRVGRLQLEFTDFIGVSRCRLVTREVLARDGLPNFPWVNIAHDVADGEPDPDHMGPNSSTFWLNPDPATYAPLPYVPGVASVQCTLVNADGSRYAGCARSLVADYAGRLEAEGFAVAMAFEPEGSVLRQEPDGRWVYASNLTGRPRRTTVPGFMKGRRDGNPARRPGDAAHHRVGDPDVRRRGGADLRRLGAWPGRPRPR